MIIRAQQLRVFQDIAEESFEEDVANHIISNHPDASFELPDEIMESFVIEGSESEEELTAELPNEIFFKKEIRCFFLSVFIIKLA